MSWLAQKCNEKIGSQIDCEQSAFHADNCYSTDLEPER